MLRLSKLIAVLLAAIWLPMAMHHHLEHAGCAKAGLCSGESCGASVFCGDEGCHCNPAGCTGIDTGSYLANARIATPQPGQPAVDAAEDPPARCLCPPVETAGVLPSDSGPNRLAEPWQFVFRAASLARAPSAVC